MEVIDKHIATGHKTISARSSLINIGQCDRSTDIVTPISENHESSTGATNTHSLYKINDNIEHGNIHSFVTPNGVHPPRNSVSNNISNTLDFNQNWISSKTNTRELFPYFRGNY